MNDISLFPLPSSLAQEISPLHLATQSVQVGENLHSIAYWNGEIHIDPIRTVKAIEPHRMVTTLDIPAQTKREGTCGSPVLNQAGEVVGMHAGNSARRQEGYVIPVKHIRQALQAYHEGSFQQPLFFRGKNLGSVGINEYIVLAQAYSQGKLLHWVNILHRKQRIDYAHLEKLFNFSNIDQVVLVVERNPLSMKDKEQHYQLFNITYDIRTGVVTRTKKGNYDLPIH